MRTEKKAANIDVYKFIIELNFIFAPDARFVYKRLPSDIRIQKCEGQRYIVEEHGRPKITKSFVKYSQGNLVMS